MDEIGRHTLRERRPKDAYWAVIPAYNEAATVRDVAIRAREQLANVIVVDDGSTDGTAQVLSGLDVTVLHNKTNCGKAASLCYGFEYALDRGAVGVVTLDADGQHVPEEISRFVRQSLHEPNTLLVGARESQERRRSVWRYLANRIADFWISWAAGRWIEDSQSGFRLYPSTMLRGAILQHDKARSFVYESEILIESARLGFGCRTITVTVRARAGESPSHFRPLSDIAGITKMVAVRLLARGLYLPGLVRAVREYVSRNRVVEAESNAMPEVTRKVL